MLGATHVTRQAESSKLVKDVDLCARKIAAARHGGKTAVPVKIGLPIRVRRQFGYRLVPARARAK
jgi:hypothetical protein